MIISIALPYRKPITGGLLDVAAS